LEVSLGYIVSSGDLRVHSEILYQQQQQQQKDSVDGTEELWQRESRMILA
jgi:hypothetical protein